jgi:putative transposase
VALARKMRGDNGVRRAVSANLKAIEGLALERPPLPITSIYRRVKQFAASTGESTSSYWTIYRVVRALPEGLHTRSPGQQGVQ